MKSVYGDFFMDDGMNEIKTCSWRVKNACKILFAKPEGVRPFVRPRHRWEVGYKTHLKIVERECKD
jgi:hypothetical protein